MSPLDDAQAGRTPQPPRGAAGGPLSPADLLTLSRLGLAVALWFVEPTAVPMLTLMVAAALSDVLDGRLARRARRGATAPPGGGRGAWLDPLCDKAFVVSLVARAAAVLAPPLWFLALVGAREALLLVALAAHLARGGSSGRPVEFTASALGKATTALQFCALGLLYARGRPTAAALWAAVGSAAAGALAVLGYARRNRPRPRTGKPT
jgi:cardiolipin synthase